MPSSFGALLSFSGVKTECFLGEVDLAAALWGSFVCSVFRDGMVYECLDELGSVSLFFLCLLFSDLGHVGETSWTGMQRESGWSMYKFQLLVFIYLFVSFYRYLR